MSARTSRVQLTPTAEDLVRRLAAQHGLRLVCVVARGDAYFIDVDDPQHWWVLEDSPVVAVRSATAEGALVLATPRRVMAVGRDGVAWRTPRLAIDGIELATPAGGELRGVADPRDDAKEFVVDVRTGRHEGGV